MGDDINFTEKEWDFLIETACNAYKRGYADAVAVLQATFEKVSEKELFDSFKQQITTQART